MTITATPSQISYAGDGVSLAFAIPFVFDTSADIKVILTSAAGVPAVLATGFSITGGGGSTGTCTMSVAPAVGETLVVLDNPSLTQPVDYTDNDAFAASTHEGALDRTERQVKRLNQRVDRSIRFADGDLSDGDSNILPISSARQGKFLAFDSVGKPTVSAGTGGGDAALRTDLANSIAGAEGSRLVGTRRTETGSVARTTADKLNQRLDAKDFNAKFDGATDDTTAMTNAITAAGLTVSGAVGNTVNLPLGTAILQSQRTLPNNVRLGGTNKNGSILKASGTWNSGTSPYMLLASNGASSMFDSLLEDLTINANDIAGLGCVQSNGWQENSGPRSCLFQGFRTYGLLLSQAGYAASGGASYLKIEDCEFFPSTLGATGAIKIEQISSVGTFIVRMSEVTIASGLAFPVLPRGVDIVNDSTLCNLVHFEYCTSGFYIDGVGEHTLENCTGGPGVTNLVEIAATFRGTLKMINCKRGGATRLILDNRVGGLGGVTADLTDFTLGPPDAHAISGITIAAAAVVTVSDASATNPFVVGSKITFAGVLGMTQINGLQGTVSAVGGVLGAWTATTNINSGAFSAYTSGGAASTYPSRALSADNTAKAWCVFDGTLVGTNAPISGINVKSVTRVSAGRYQVNFLNPLLAANTQCFSVMPAALTAYAINNQGPAAGFAEFIIEVLTVAAGVMVATPTDNASINFVCFGQGT